MFNWLREWYELRAYLAQQKVCPSCEVLKTELNQAHREKEALLREVLKEAPPEPIRTAAPEMNTVPISRRHIPWAVRQQMLEREDRAKAIALKNAAQPSTSVEELEKELDAVATERENKSDPTAGVNR